MKKVMLIGETRVGKSTLIQSLSGEDYSSHRAMAVEYCGPFINIPGEFLENSRFYHVLISTSVECDILVLIQDATRSSSLFPPLFASMFNRKIIGVITKTDVPDANVERAERLLRNAGVKEVVAVSSETGAGLDILRSMLL